jgi:two-component system response regulator HydG
MQPANFPPHRILVIDDDSADSIFLVEEMKRARPQATIETARTAEEGLLKVRKNAYDLVLCNFNLPGISGLAFMKLSLELQPNTPVILLTTQSSEDLEQDSYREGAYGFLRKPLRADNLHRVIHGALAGQRRFRVE